jgi:methyl-accepting chemotaxis protein
MITRKDMAKVSGAIASASSSTEEKFLDIGKKLESASDLLATLTGTFDTLSDELTSENLRCATQDLSRIASQVSRLAGSHNEERAVFQTLMERANAIQHSMSRMNKALQGVGILAVNAKIAAAHIGSAGDDFVVFAKDIGRTLTQAQASLELFANELAGLGKHLRDANASLLAFEARQA